MDVGLNKIENVTILSIKGRADVSSAPKLENACKKILDQHEKDIIIDCTQLDFISSAGLRVLLKLAKEIKKNAGRLAVAHVNDLVRNILEISGFIELFPIYDNVVKGLSHFQDKS
ncbi:MAG: STAS domain-containing protein [bacterium]